MIRPMLVLLLATGSACGQDPGLRPASDDTDDADADTDTDASPQPVRLRFIEQGADWLPDALPAPRRAAVALHADADRQLDLAELSGADVHVVHGASEASRIVATVEGAVGLVPLDLDRDGRDELLVLGGEGPDQLLRGTEEGAWTATALPAGGRVAAVGDLDGDERPDVVSLTAAGPRWWRGDAAGELIEAPLLGLPRLAPAGSLLLMDVDGDDHADLVHGRDGEVPAIYLGDGAGAFLRASADALPSDPGVGRVVAAADMDGDDDVDLLLAGVGTPRLLLADGGRWRDVSAVALPRTPGSATGIAVSDLDRDGHPDVVLAHAEHPLTLWRSDGDGRWFDYSDVATRASAGSGATSMVAADLDRDGHLDLYVTRDDLRRPRLWRAWPAEDRDGDGDGVPDQVDVCPDTWDPDQADRDFEPFACEGRSGCSDRTGCTLVWIDEVAALRCGRKTWTKARDTCASWGARLMVPTSDADTEALLAAGVSGWIGVSDRDVEGTWVDVDGVALAYAPWREGEPNNASGAEDCGELGSDGLWNDIPCDRELPFTCLVREPYAARDPGDACDVCPGILDDQADTDEDGVGDACDPS